jgi:hypothetical protein
MMIARLTAAIVGLLVAVAAAGMPSAAADTYDPDSGTYSSGTSPGDGSDQIAVPDGTASNTPWESGGEGPDYTDYGGTGGDYYSGSGSS